VDGAFDVIGLGSPVCVVDAVVVREAFGSGLDLGVEIGEGVTVSLAMMLCDSLLQAMIRAVVSKTKIEVMKDTFHL